MRKFRGKKGKKFEKKSLRQTFILNKVKGEKLLIIVVFAEFGSQAKIRQMLFF